jgi:GT2 family glycosyltransferase
MISVIIPTIGRPASLRRLLVSLARQTLPVDEIIVADASGSEDTQTVLQSLPSLPTTHLRVREPNAVHQRQAAIAAAKGDMFLLLDDDVELEPGCVAELDRVMHADARNVAAMAHVTNSEWPKPSPLWRAYLFLVHGIRGNAWQGRVLGPLLRYGYNPLPDGPAPIEWFGSGLTLLRRDAYDKAGGFSDFFLHRSTMHEDVDLALRVGRHGRMWFCPDARLAHYHDPAGRSTLREAAQDDMHNRALVLHRTAHRSKLSTAVLSLAFLAVEAASNAIGAVVRLKPNPGLQLLAGRLSGLRLLVRN